MMKRSATIVFMGTSAFAVPILHALSCHCTLDAVVTQPDRPRGRGRGLAMSPVKESALKLHVPILQPERSGDPSFVERIGIRRPRFIVVAAYGQILSEHLLQIPELGCINVHASLLPKYRGAAPIHWAIAEGESNTGVTTMMMDKGMDTGPILLKQTVPIGPRDTAGSLERKLAEAGAEIIVRTVSLLEKGRIQPVLQDDSQVTYAPSIKKEDGWIDWAQPAVVLHRRIRAFTPWPGAFTRLGDKILKVFFAEVDEEPHDMKPGRIVEVCPEGIRVTAGKGYLILTEIQLEGKKRMAVRDFVLGHRVVPGTMLNSRKQVVRESGG